MSDNKKLVCIAISLLETDDVKNKIFSVIEEYNKSKESVSDGCDNSPDKIAELQEALYKCEQEKEKEIDKVKAELQAILYKYEQEKLQKENELNKVKAYLEAEQEKNKSISNVLILFEKYNNLSEEIRTIRLANVISCKSIISFIISCSNYDNLLSIWDFCKSMILSENNGRNTELEVLKDIFYYFFNQLGNSMNTPKFKLLDTQVGETFDDQYHIRGRNSKVSGRITDVILNGVVQCNNNVCKRQSIVAIREK